MTYRATLLRTAIFVPVSLTDRALWRSIGVHAGELAVAPFALAVRIGTAVLYPVAVLILTALVVASARRDARRPSEATGVVGEADGSKATFPRVLIDPECGMPAYFRIGVPHRGDPVLTGNMEHIDGSPFSPNDPIVCDSCGRDLGWDTMAGRFTNPELWALRETHADC